MRKISILWLLAACSQPAGAPTAKNPATLRQGCEAPEEGRVLRARLELERGEGKIAVDGQAGGPCAVYELTPGPHAVAVHAEGVGAGPFGLAAILQAHADGNAYDVFDLHCGFPGPCDNDTLRAWQSAVRADRTKMTDPCAALTVTDIRWESKQLDEVHPSALDVTFNLHVYGKPSGKPPRDPSCPEK